jgi:hypothetical protein
MAGWGEWRSSAAASHHPEHRSDRLPGMILGRVVEVGINALRCSGDGTRVTAVPTAGQILSDV